MSRFSLCELKAMASESDMGYPLRITVLVEGYEQWGRSHNIKAQNVVRLASNVGYRVTPRIVRCHFSFDCYRGGSSPLIEIGCGGSGQSLKERGLIFRLVGPQ